VEALSQIANEPRFSRKMLWLTQERIEEVRAWMNTTLGQTIDNLEMQRGNALEGQRASREQRAVKPLRPGRNGLSPYWISILKLF